MSKIFEALEQARRNTTGGEKTKSMGSQPSVASISPAASLLDIENETITLYQTIDSLLSNTPKKIIQFIGSKEGEGVSTIVREFAVIAAAKYGKSVLIVDANYRNPVQLRSSTSFLGLKYLA